MNYIIYDLVILAVLVVLAIWGMHRGLILSLCSLLAVLVAFLGAILVTNFLAPSVTGWVQPTLQPAVTSAIQSALPESAADAELPLHDLLILLDEAELPFGLDRFLDNVQAEDIPILSSGSLVESLAVSLSEKLALAVTCIFLFLISFLLILILWRLIGRALDLVARLPGLHTLNKLGGFVFGAFRGAVLLFVCAWILRQLGSGLIPAEMLEQTTLLNFFMTVDPLEFLASL